MVKSKSLITLEPSMKIVVLPAKKNTVLLRDGSAAHKRVQKVLSSGGKTVEFARKSGVPASTLRYLARAKVIRLVPQKENKTAEVVALMKRVGGVTREEVLVVTGWKAVSMQQVAGNAGVKLKIDDRERPFVYRVLKK